MNDTDILDDRGRAFPVYKGRKGVFYVPATRAQYRILRKVQFRSSARCVKTAFFKAVTLPGYPNRVPAIRIRLPNLPHELLAESGSDIAALLNKADWQKDGKKLIFLGTGSACDSTRVPADISMLMAGTACKLKLSERRTKCYQPDSSLRFCKRDAANKKLSFPFLIIEAAVSQTQTKLARKIHHWIQGSRGHLAYLCVLQLRESEGTTPTTVTATVIQPYTVQAPTSTNPAEWLMDSRTIVPEVEVYPRIPPESFTISLGDTSPKDLNLDPGFADQYITVPFHIFHTKAEMAVAEFDATGSNATGPFDSNQQPVPTAPTSESGIDVESSEDEPDDSEGDDPSYEEG
ncbi:MAG: hypothetical protein LQ352_005004 [Teloschistes flavicans]|nr:MAG: hypothetical protein LQ352_005004 [Teloschistes flavicans]